AREIKNIRIAASVLAGLSADGKYIATLPRPKDDVYDIRTTTTGEREKSTFEEGAKIGTGAVLGGVWFGPNSNLVAVHFPPRLKLLDWRTGMVRQEFVDFVWVNRYPAFSPDGDKIAWVNLKSQAIVHCTATGEQLYAAPTWAGVTAGLCFSPD